MTFGGSRQYFVKYSILKIPKGTNTEKQNMWAFLIRPPQVIRPPACPVKQLHTHLFFLLWQPAFNVAAAGGLTWCALCLIWPSGGVINWKIRAAAAASDPSFFVFLNISPVFFILWPSSFCVYCDFWIEPPGLSCHYHTQHSRAVRLFHVQVPFLHISSLGSKLYHFSEAAFTLQGRSLPLSGVL